MGQLVKLPIPIETVQFDDTLESVEAIHNMGLEPAVAAGNSGPELVLQTPMGALRLPVGWWLLKERGGAFWCSPGVLPTRMNASKEALPC